MKKWMGNRTHLHWQNTNTNTNTNQKHVWPSIHKTKINTKWRFNILDRRQPNCESAIVVCLEVSGCRVVLTFRNANSAICHDIDFAPAPYPMDISECLAVQPKFSFQNADANQSAWVFQHFWFWMTSTECRAVNSPLNSAISLLISLSEVRTVGSLFWWQRRELPARHSECDQWKQLGLIRRWALLFILDSKWFASNLIQEFDRSNAISLIVSLVDFQINRI